MKWVLLLPILCILQEVKSYPQYNCAECNQHKVSARAQRVEDSIVPLFDSQRSWMPRFALLPSLSDTFNTTLAYMTKKLELLEESCKQITEHLKEVVNELLLNKKKNKKPVTSENSVSTDNKPENLNQIIPKPDHELIVNQKPVAVKDDKKGKPIKQGDKEDIPAPIKNENTIAPSSNENTVSTIVPTNQAETTIKENGQTEKPETLHESEKLETISSSEEKPQSEVSKPDESEKENAQEGDNKETMEEKDS